MGKIENCNASCIFIEVSKTIKANVILMIIRKLRSHGGNGMTSIATIIMTTASSPYISILHVIPSFFHQILR